jgi:hypothetical protein
MSLGLLRGVDLGIQDRRAAFAQMFLQERLNQVQYRKGQLCCSSPLFVFVGYDTFVCFFFRQVVRHQEQVLDVLHPAGR